MMKNSTHNLFVPVIVLVCTLLISLYGHIRCVEAAAGDVNSDNRIWLEETILDLN
ncbi:MAG: hypothetical protein JRJ23_02015 [Deltaproteobacteria bacterium]|nr:hypothetical protein [Deltaproteobacteria bacterium]MBW1914314.1 hypothetical protein [Deltaproteobacteria bacterium]